MLDKKISFFYRYNTNKPASLILEITVLNLALCNPFNPKIFSQHHAVFLTHLFFCSTTTRNVNCIRLPAMVLVFTSCQLFTFYVLPEINLNKDFCFSAILKIINSFTAQHLFLKLI